MVRVKTTKRNHLPIINVNTLVVDYDSVVEANEDCSNMDYDVIED